MDNMLKDSREESKEKPELVARFQPKNAPDLHKRNVGQMEDIKEQDTESEAQVPTNPQSQSPKPAATLQPQSIDDQKTIQR